MIPDFIEEALKMYVTSTGDYNFESDGRPATLEEIAEFIYYTAIEGTAVDYRDLSRFIAQELNVYSANQFHKYSAMQTGKGEYADSCIHYVKRAIKNLM